MSVCLSLLVLLLLCSHLRCRSKSRKAQQEAGLARRGTEDCQRRLQEQTRRSKAREALLLLEIARTTLDCARTAVERDAWASYAIAHEALCDAISDGDVEGAVNASVAIAGCRGTLRILGQYDA
jgi:hypothetical protein